MRTKTRIGFAVLFFGLLIAVFVKGWLWYDQLTERMFASVQRQIDFELDVRQVHYDPVNEILSLESATVSAPGLEISARSLELEIDNPGWLDIALQYIPVTIESSRFIDATLHADSPQSLLPLTGLGNTVFQGGTLEHAGSTSLPLPFSFLAFTPLAGTSQSLIEGSGSDDLSWSFAGTLDTNNNQMVGKLDFKHQAIGAFLSDSRYSGHFDASLELNWSDSAPVLLTGDMKGDSGGYQSEDFSLGWNGWQFTDVQLADGKFVGNQQALQLDSAELDLASARIIPFFDWLKAQPFYTPRLKTSQLRIKLNPDSAALVYRDAILRLKSGNAPCQFTAEPEAGGQLTVKADDDGHYQLKFKNVSSERLGLIPTLRPFGFADRRYNFSYNSRTGKGRLTFGKKKASSEYSLAERLLFDREGQAELSFVAPDLALLDVRKAMASEVGRQLTVLINEPFAYLSQLTASALLPYLEHTPGLPGLTAAGTGNLNILKQLSEERPGLKWQLQACVSATEDWPQIARNHLEQTLTDLYPKEGAPPESEREKLIEQLYLVTQKQKMPDVGLVSREERILQAEQWLLESWPKNPELLDDLLNQRKQYLAGHLENYGLEGVINLTAGQGDDQPRSRLLVK